HFKTIEELKKTVYVKADEYHSEYITNIQSENPMKDIGLKLEPKRFELLSIIVEKSLAVYMMIGYW
ncbi:hypothetical protein CLOSTHATH_06922, partial [Hungatella hathewayi DSM 13479]